MITQNRKLSGTVTDALGVPFDMTNLTAVEFQLKTTGTAVGGSWKLQKSSNGADWFDIPSATGNFTTATTAAYTLTGIVASSIRVLFAITSGAVTYDIVFNGKELV